jgi:hypothetical protein
MIAILAWSSLIWKPQNLPYKGFWKKGGPTLPLEFTRITEIRPLTLVLDPTSGVACPTWFAISSRDNLFDAIEDLKSREDAPDECIGYVDVEKNRSSLQEYPQQINIENIVRDWCNSNKIPAAIWTALPPNFTSLLGVDFSVDAAVNYLKDLPQKDQESALEYIRKTPDEISTPLRRRVAQEWSV